MEPSMPPRPTPDQKSQPATQAFRIQQLRDLIAKAVGEGVASDDLLLRLTSRDASALKRHPAVGLTEISFLEGQMRFLGVKVQEGGVEAPLLERSA
jgi:hypothetical protein